MKSWAGSRDVVSATEKVTHVLRQPPPVLVSQLIAPTSHRGHSNLASPSALCTRTSSLKFRPERAAGVLPWRPTMEVRAMS